MRRIYKYELNYACPCQLNLPPFSKFLHFDYQGGVPVVWLLVNANTSKREQVNFYVYTTGESIPEDFVHRGTAMKLSERFVAHLFTEKGALQ